MKADRRRFTVRSAAVMLALAATLTAAPATAQPPDETSDAMERYQELGAQAAKADEDLLQAQEELERSQRERERAEAALTRTNQALEQARRREEAFRGEIDRFTSATFRGGNVNRFSAILISDSRREFLDQMSALDVLATNNAEALGRLRDAVARADAARAEAAKARKRAQDAATSAERAVNTLQQRRADLDAQIQQVRQALDALSSAERESLQTVQDNGSYLGPPGAANDALQAALSKRGSPYEWGAEGPDTFDCSGLTSWAYQQAGVTIPRTSRDQYTAGQAVSLNALVPGDLLFFDDGTGNPSAIHHVGMYVGEGKMVDAPTEGQVVDVRSMEGDGHLMGARRIVG